MGVLTDRGLFRAPFIIDATGRRRAASGWLNIPWNRRGPERRAWYGYVTADDRAADAPTLTADEAGWTWVAQVRPDLCQWVRLNFDNSQPTATWRPPQLAGLTACGPLRGADVTCRISRRTAGNGYFLVGDAAAILDPISSHGVLKALMSGTMAAHLIRQVLGGDVSPLSASRYYKKWIGDWFEYDAAQLDALYAQLGRVPLGQIPANR
jgi:flavin-dependent dehydrogenase